MEGFEITVRPIFRMKLQKARREKIVFNLSIFNIDNLNREKKVKIFVFGKVKIISDSNNLVFKCLYKK